MDGWLVNGLLSCHFLLLFFPSLLVLHVFLILSSSTYSLSSSAISLPHCLRLIISHLSTPSLHQLISHLSIPSLFFLKASNAECNMGTMRSGAHISEMKAAA